MQAFLCHHAGMVTRSETQYTLRGVPPAIDRGLRQLAQKKKLSLNALLIHLLVKEIDGPKTSQTHHDLDRFITSWVHDPEIEEALSSQRCIESGDWT